MKTIFTSLAPNVEKDDAILALKMLFRPWRWKRGAYIKHFYEELKKLFGTEYAFVFESGRTALYALLKAFDLKESDEVLLQAFTCVAVPNAILWAGAKPVYVDCNETFTMAVSDLKKKITPRSKVLIIQHTFGISADMDAILKVAREHKLFVIEDGAHSLGLITPQGDASFYSFGRDKIISSSFGGAAVVNNPVIGERLRAIKTGMIYPSGGWVLRQILYPVVMHVVRRTYDNKFGKLLLSFVRTFHILGRPVEPMEKSSQRPVWQPRRMPNALAKLGFYQLKKLSRYNEHRRMISAEYALAFKGAGILRFSMRHDHPSRVRELARRKNIFLGDWYTTGIAPIGVSYEAVGYVPASCPVAERLCTEVVNLPTDIHISKEDAQRIISTIRGLGTV